MRILRFEGIGLILGMTVLAAVGPTQEVSMLAEQASSEDATQREAAFTALCEMGQAGVTGLLNLLVPQGQGNDAGARIALHGMALRLSAPGELDGPRAKFAEALAAYLRGGADAQCKNFVIAQLQICGRAESVPALVAALDQEELASTAVQALAANPAPEALAALREAVTQTSGEIQIGVILALGKRRDGEAVSILIKAAKSGGEARLAALTALGMIGDERGERIIATALNTTDKRAQRVAFDAYLRLAEGLTMAGKRAEARKVYLEAIQAAKTPILRQAALLGLGQVGTADDVKVIVNYLVDPEENVRRGALTALVNLPDPKAGTALAQASHEAEGNLKLQLLVVLSQRTEPVAKRAIEEGLKSDDPAVRVRALELLGRLGEPEFRETLLEAARGGEVSPVYTVALRAYIAQANALREGGEPSEAIRMYQTAFKLAQTGELRRLALEGLTSVPDVDSLPDIIPYLGDKEVSGAALRAYASIATLLADQGQTDRAREMLENALEYAPPRDVLALIAQELRELGVNIDPARESGFVTHWWVIGPFEGDDVNRVLPPEQGIDLSAKIEANGRQLNWTPHHTADITGIVDLAAMMTPNNNVTAYMYAEVTVPQEQDILLKSGSDDRLRIWLNDEVVFTFAEPRSLIVDQDTTEAHLRAGTNRILMKVTQGGGGWSACLRITSRDGKPLKFEQKTQ
ncbi:MAG: HEAT repeat domain-containing protein [Candidatus Zipacnadales bacterium]